MKKIFETGMLLFAMMGFWGMIYPDLCFTEDVCEISIEEEATLYVEKKATHNEDKALCDAKTDVEDTEESDMPLTDIFTRLCMAEPGQIRVKSRFVEVFITGKQGKIECHQ